jgi:7,8-dihydropterin-6-yl-methyl-4-(beta-D-ribofuranosyl)aminobenzene 5'-phosphate synthase
MLKGLAVVGLAGMATTSAHAEPLKIALVETLSGGQAVTGKLFQAAIKFGLTKLEKEKPWPDGVVLVVGCSHPGIEAIVAEAAKINPRIHFVAGGFHMVAAPDEPIAKMAASLHDKWHVEWIAPGHCTGEYTFAGLRQAFGDHYRYAGLGTRLMLGADVHARVGGRDADGWAMDGEDYSSYGRLLAVSDDAPASMVARRDE